MANPSRGEVALQAGDKTYTLKLGTNALSSLTGTLSMGMEEIRGALIAGRIDVIRAVLWAALLKEHKLDLIQTGDVMDEAGFDVVGQAIGEALKLAFPDAKPDENPPKAA